MVVEAMRVNEVLLGECMRSLEVKTGPWGNFDLFDFEKSEYEANSQTDLLLGPHWKNV